MAPLRVVVKAPTVFAKSNIRVSVSLEREAISVPSSSRRVMNSPGKGIPCRRRVDGFDGQPVPGNDLVPGQGQDAFGSEGAEQGLHRETRVQNGGTATELGFAGQENELFLRHLHDIRERHGAQDTIPRLGLARPQIQPQIGIEYRHDALFLCVGGKGRSWSHGQGFPSS